MSEKQLKKIERALETGYRVKANGSRVMLSNEMRRQFELKIKSYKSRHVKYAYVSTKRVFDNDGNPIGWESTGPALKMVVDGREVYVSRETLIEERLKQIIQTIPPSKLRKSA